MKRKLLESWIDKQKWIFAKSYAKTAPHEYLLLKDLTEKDKRIFKNLAKKIKEEGYDSYFYKAKFRYLRIGEYKYWSMDKTIETTNLINRDKFDANYTKNGNRKDKSAQSIL